MPRLDTPQAEVSPGRQSADGPSRHALQIALRGHVQGLGIRPAIARLAADLQLLGHVCNTPQGVQIHVEGSRRKLRAFTKRLVMALPHGAVVESQVNEVVTPYAAIGFRIKPNTSGGAAAVRVPPDVVVCRECLSEVVDASNHRHNYAFTTCTSCGPRYSLLEGLPYDRSATSMKQFVPCARCQHEYETASDRRFHSQTNCCPTCGPAMWLGTHGGRVLASGADAIGAAVAELRLGRILALRGLGGYQLLVAAGSSSAVRELRRRKRREGKPLAVMVSDLQAAEQMAQLSSDEHQVLASRANPIVIASIKQGAPLAPEVTAGLDTVGLMLPSTPLHHLLARNFNEPLVVTSGNVEGEPIAFAPGAAERELCSCADCWLEHDRPIVHPIDDSVVRVVAGRVATIRLARGMAPLALDLQPLPIVALGGHQKAAIALGNGSQCALGPHVADLEGEAGRARYLDHLNSLRRMYAAQPLAWACDEHPDYFTSRWAAEQQQTRLQVQHHHAHVAAAMLEHGWLDRQVLGVTWDGSGFGADQTIWGGEFLRATVTGYERVGHLRPFVLPGGESAIRQPWRVAVSLVLQAAGPEAAAALRFAHVTPQQVAQVSCLLQRSRSSPTTTSAGRLFDGVAAMVLGTSGSQFEGQPAMLLEAACEFQDHACYPLPLAAGNQHVLDWRPLVRAVLDDVARQTAPGVIAMRFHRALASGIAAVTRRFRGLSVVLCGGCFQNRLLTELVAEKVAGLQSLATPGVIPTGDGGLAAGQLAVATARFVLEHRTCA